MIIGIILSRNMGLFVCEKHKTKPLHEKIELRAESIDGRLNGTIPSTDAGQRQDSSNLVDASHIGVKAMGQFNMGSLSP